MPRLKIICAGCLHPIRKAAVDHLGGMALLCDKCKEDRISEIARLMRKHGAESHEPNSESVGVSERMREIRDRIDVIFLHGKADQDEYHALLRERWALQEKCPHEGMIDSKPTCPVCGKILCVR